MLCQRCDGLMEVIFIRHLLGEEVRSEVATLRCINCGNVEDSVIRSNRANSPKRNGIDLHSVEHDNPIAAQTDSLDCVLPSGRMIEESAHTRILRLPVTPHLTSMRIHEDTSIASPPEQTHNTERCP